MAQHYGVATASGIAQKSIPNRRTMDPHAGNPAQPTEFLIVGSLKTPSAYPITKHLVPKSFALPLQTHWGSR